MDLKALLPISLDALSYNNSYYFDAFLRQYSVYIFWL